MEGQAAAVINGADTAWVLISAAIVMAMTPGLGFFYGGMVRTKHVVSTMYQVLIAMGVVGITWVTLGYSLAFSGNIGGWIGDLGHLFLNGVGDAPRGSGTIPHSAFMLFQGQFAVITPALVVGAFAERVSFKAWLLIMVLWSLLIYSPVCHWVWGDGGWIAAHGGLDFAGGLVVHTTAGVSALVCALTFGRRKDFLITHERPYDVGFVVLGTMILFMGWFGFNGGSALGANALAAHACATTFFAGVAALLGWTLIDWMRHGKPSSIGSCIGAIVGLVAITPAAGFVSIPSAVLIGFITAVASNYIASFCRHQLKLDDTLDVFACHGVGGIIGALLTGVFCTKAVNAAGADGLIYGNAGPLMANLKGVIAVGLYTAVMTYIILKVVNAITDIRVSYKDETEGLDSSQHNEMINANIQMKYGERTPTE